MQNTKSEQNVAPGALAFPAEPELLAWVEKLISSHGNSVAAVIMTSRLLARAKVELHGRWGKLFAMDLLPYGQRRAQMTIEIAKCAPLADPKNFSHLPDSWTVLHALTKIPAAALAQAIVSGRVQPATTLKQARELARAGKPPGAQNQWRKFNVDWRLELLARHIDRELRLWPKADWAELASALRDLAGSVADLAQTAKPG